MPLQAFGLSAAGFKPKDFNDIKEEVETTLKNEVDPYLRFGSDSVVGILTAIIANQSRQVWEALAGLYSSLQPDSASGRALDSLCSLTGTYRRRASYSRVKAKVTLDANTTLPSGSRIKTSSGDFFKTTKKVTNKSSTQADIDVELIAEETGPKLAHAKSTAEIMTPMAGWSAVSIIKNYELGRNVETDDELRLRRLEELRASGSATLGSIRSRLLQLNSVEAVHIKEGEHSFETIIKGGNPEEIARTLWNCKPLGVKTAGQEQHTITDSIGQERIIRFSRPEVLYLTMDISLKVAKKLSIYEIDEIKNALADFAAENFAMGQEVYPSRFYGTALKHHKVLDVTKLEMGRYVADGNTAQPIGQIEVHQIPSLIPLRINLNSVIEEA